MSSPRILWLVVAAGTVIVLGTVGRLPPVVATHFDVRGVPNGWVGRGGCLLAATGLVVHLLVREAHRASPPRLSTPGILGLLGFLLAAAIAWGIAWRRAAART